MKKLSSIFMLAMMCMAAVCFTACGGDDDGGKGGAEASIVGVWECTSYDVQTSLPDYTKQTDVGDRISFNSNGTYSTDKETGRWKQNGRTLTLMLDAEISIPVEYKIEKLTASELELSGNIGILQFYIKLKRIS